MWHPKIPRKHMLGSQTVHNARSIFSEFCQVIQALKTRALGNTSQIRVSTELPVLKRPYLSLGISKSLTVKFSRN
ncbi:hypothetical protein RchiOBHm_Chr1g0318711 [Rosa chinensis]|uniref:Uncharacterized protein n=1 Tax=Rosa chinensis TaxID=74649 RepID=A0A2P6S885_ROSCH|nr:hypothetical protein RchiOBHm_Chr1g0318711 [Rosa chinensis]